MPLERAPPDVSIWSFLARPQSCRRRTHNTLEGNPNFLNRTEPTCRGPPSCSPTWCKMRQPHDSAAKVKPGEGPEGFDMGVCPSAARVQFAEVTAQNASHQQDLDAVVGPCWKVSQEFFFLSVSTCRQFSQQSDFGRGGPEGFHSNKLQMNFHRRPQEVVL